MRSMSFRRGDVILVRYPDSNLTTFKKRPALVVQADDTPTGLSQRIIACITSNLGRAGRIPAAKHGRLLPDARLPPPCSLPAAAEAVPRRRHSIPTP